MSATADVAVVGLGAMGSAAAFHCARRGARVLGFDRFAPPHARGSSHGETRILREAYFEDPRYVPLVQRAYDLWRELEVMAGARLLCTTGGLMIGPEHGVLVRGARLSAETHGLPYERLDARQIRDRFPALDPREDMVAIWEPRAGVLFPEACVREHLAAAVAHGAELCTDETVEEWRAAGDGFEIVTSRGRHRAARLVLAANAWLPSLLPDVPLGLVVTRQPLFWFEPLRDPALFAPERLPIHLWEPEPDRFFYGFPAFDGLLKVATHGEGAPSDPDTIDREVHPPEIEALRRRLEAYLPGAAGRFARAAVCMYANTPDAHFVIDRHPAHERVLVVSACSGHGFKFAPAIGEAAADLLFEGRARVDLDLFRLGREGLCRGSTTSS
jgi:sarcosine oxidase